MDADKIEKLMGMKKKVDKARKEVDEAKGALKELDLSLKKEFDIDNEENGKIIFDKKEKELKEVDVSIENQITILEEKFNWD